MQERFEIRLGDAIREAWTIFMKGPEVFVSLTFLYFAVVFVMGSVPLVGNLIAFVFFSLLPAAFILAAESGRGDGKISFESLQKLMPLFPQLLALGIAKSVLIMIGFMFLVLPGIYAMVALAFAELFLVLKNRSFVEAMKDSHRLAHENLFGVLGLLIFCGMLAISGMLLVFIGLLVTIPVAVLVPYCVFKRIDSRPTVLEPEVVPEIKPEIVS